VLDTPDIDMAQALLPFGAFASEREFPASRTWVPAEPMAIAWAHVLGNHLSGRDLTYNPESGTGVASVDDFAYKGDASEKRFPVIGAYDGDGAGVGRVIVDSTWHHWLSLNVTGRPEFILEFEHGREYPPGMMLAPPIDPRKELGFLATSVGRAAYRKIQNYWINVALWLMPRRKRAQCMAPSIILNALLLYPMFEGLNPRSQLHELGRSLRFSLHTYVGPVLAWDLLLDLLPESDRVHQLFRQPRRIVDDGPTAFTDPPPEVFETYLLGGVARELLQLLYDDAREADERDQDVIDEAYLLAIRRGLALGLDAFLAYYHRAVEVGGDVSKELTEVLAFDAAQSAS
jgi:hypothetical protein